MTVLKNKILSAMFFGLAYANDSTVQVEVDMDGDISLVQMGASLATENTIARENAIIARQNAIVELLQKKKLEEEKSGFDINNTKFSVMSGKRIFGPNFGFRV